MLPTLLTRAGLKALPWGEICIALAVVFGVGAGVYWFANRIDTARAEGYNRGKAECQVQCDVATMAAQSAALRADIERREREQQDRAAIDREIEHARQSTEAAVRQRDNSDAVSARLRVAVNAAAARCDRAGAASPAPASGGASAPTAADLLTYVHGRIDEAAGELADEADRRRIAGLACERISDGLARTAERER